MNPTTSSAVSSGASGAPTVSETHYPRPTVAWYMVGLLTVAYVFSFVDRIILGLLAGPIKDDMGLSDLEFGLLIGPAFAVFYATMGLPLGYLADHRRRTWIVAAGIALWSAATIACGLTRHYWQLFVARMMVGVGEATLSPCTMSMISDSYPPHKRGKPIAFYTAALSLGSGIAYLGGGAIISWANSTGPMTLPLLGTLTTWQLVFIAVGAPGLLLAIPMFLLREPKRLSDSGGTNPAAAGNLLDMLRHVGGRWAMYASFASLFCFMTIIAYSHSWLPVTFERTWGWSIPQYAFAYGIAILILGPLAVNLAGWLSDKYSQRGYANAPMWIALVGFLITLLTSTIGPLMPNAWAAFGVLAISNVGIAFLSAVGVTALLNVAPTGVRAQLVALYYMAISLSGLLLGPTTVGLMSDQLFGTENIRYSLAATTLLFGIPVLLLVPITLRLYNRALNNKA